MPRSSSVDKLIRKSVFFPVLELFFTDLFVLYCDPPVFKIRRQLGASVKALYSILIALHVVCSKLISDDRK